MKRLICALWSFSVLFAACTGDSVSERPTTSTPESVIPELTASPAATSSLDDSVVASLTIAGEPDTVAFVRGFVWTRTDDGRLIQVDPTTNEVTTDIRVDVTTDPYNYCVGIGTDGTDVFTCSARGSADTRTADIIRFDPVAKQVVATYEVDKLFDQTDLPVVDGRVWVLTGIGDHLVAIDTSTGETSSAIDLGARCFQAAATDALVILTCSLSGLVLGVDPTLMEVSIRLPLEGPNWIAADRGSVWVSQNTALVRLDAETLQPTVRVTGFRSIYDLQIDGADLWVRVSGGDFLYRIDAATGEVLEQFRLDTPLSAGSLLVTSDAFWATAFDDLMLVRYARN